MKKILVLGAGQSAPFLIRYLLDHAEAEDWHVTVGDRDPELAAERVAGHPRGEAVAFDAGGEEGLHLARIADADLVVNMLPPRFQPLIARECVRSGRHMISASYTAPAVRALSAEAKARDVLLLNEVGLDPGIDHMSTMALIDRVHREGGAVEAFESYGSGVPAPDSIANPLGYAITWNPRNVVMAAQHGAQFLRRGRIKIMPYQRVFAETWPVEVEGVGTMEAYPNRDSLAYRETFGLAGARTLIRGTLRHPGFCEAWLQVVRLGLPNEEIEIAHLAERSHADLVEMFLPEGLPGADTAARTAAFLGLDPASPAIERLRWLGLFSDEPVGEGCASPADVLVALLGRRLTLPPGGRDMVVLLHDMLVRYPTGGDGGGGRHERITATLIEHGEPGGITAMARTVGMPAAVAARLLLTGEIELRGCHIPTEPAIYRPILAELEREGVRFVERRGAAADGGAGEEATGTPGGMAMAGEEVLA